MTPAINKLSLESFEIKEYSYSIFIQLCYLTKNKPGKQWGQKHLAFLMATLENSTLFHALLKVLFNIRQKSLVLSALLRCYKNMKAGKSFGKIMPYLEITQERNISKGKVSKHCILDWKSIHEYSF